MRKLKTPDNEHITMLWRDKLLLVNYRVSVIVVHQQLRVSAPAERVSSHIFLCNTNATKTTVEQNTIIKS